MIEFAKLSATGNDFILFDNRTGRFAGDEHDFFRHICQRRKSVGADGILLLARSSDFHFSLTYYNSDGFIGEMCGNGARAAAYYAVHQRLAPAEVTFDVLGVPYRASVHGHWVKLYMPVPQEIIEYPGVVEEPDFQEGGYLNVGVPHYVLFVPEIEQVDVEGVGKKYRYHSRFQPWGTNVNFVEVVDRQSFRMRTYERGVEAETLACGTGTISAAVLARRQKNLSLPIQVTARGGLLRVDFDEPLRQITLEGEVQIVYYGQLVEDQLRSDNLQIPLKAFS